MSRRVIRGVLAAVIALSVFACSLGQVYVAFADEGGAAERLDARLQAVEQSFERFSFGTPTDAVDVEEDDGYTLNVAASADIWNGSDVTAPQTDGGGNLVISTGAELAWVAEQVNGGRGFSGDTLLLDADINLNGNAWTPIGSLTSADNLSTGAAFGGVFDGQGHTIYNISVAAADAQASGGLFGFVSGGEIKNLTVSTGGVSGGGNFGAVAGAAYAASILKCKATGIVFSAEQSVVGAAGGIVGAISGGTSVSGCVNESDISLAGGSRVGGIVGSIGAVNGEADATGACSVTDCVNSGGIYSESGTVGGVIGYVETYNESVTTAISGCANKETVETAGAGAFAGGIIGAVEGGKLSANDTVEISTCYNRAGVTGGQAVGGIVGKLLEGDVPFAKAPSVTDCYTTGEVSGTSAGYFIGSNAATPAVSVTNTFALDAIGDGITAVPYCGDGESSLSNPETLNRWYVTEGVINEKFAAKSAFTADTWNINGGFALLRTELSFTLTLDAVTNGGACGEAALTGGFGDTVTLPAATLGGAQFTGWYTQAADGELVGVEGDELTLGTDAGTDALLETTLYAAFDAQGISYTVEYNANNGIGTMESSVHAYGAASPLNANVFTRAGFTFKHWALNLEGTGATYEDEALVSALSEVDGSVVTLYAMWQPNTFYVKYNSNGGTGSMSDTQHYYGIVSRIAANEFSRSGYEFAGWNTSASGSGLRYFDESYIGSLASADNAVINLYAQWKETTYYITFDPNGGTMAAGSLLTKEITLGRPYSESLGVNENYPLLKENADKDEEKAEEEETNVLRIYTARDLAAFAAAVDGGNTYKDYTVYLMANIDLAGVAFEPIGQENPRAYFSGVFDGQGHVVKNLTINETTDQMTAFFSATDNACIRNFGIESGSITSSTAYTASIVAFAQNATVIENCFNRATVACTASAATIGGIVGRARNSSVLNCRNFADVTTAKNYAGGIVGEAFSTAVIDCTNKGNVMARSHIGGIAGMSGINTANGALIESCHNSGSLTATTATAYIGGLVGYARESTNIRNSINVSELIQAPAAANYVGGLVGWFDASTVYNSYSVAGISASAGAGRIIGERRVGTVENCLCDDTNSAALPLVNAGSAEGITVMTVDDLKSEAVGVAALGSLFMTDSTGANGGFPVLIGAIYGDHENVDIEYSNGAYLIYDAAQLRKLSYLVNNGDTFSGKTVRLMKDIDLSSALFAPIGIASSRFRGTFDGQGHVIRNLYVEQVDVQYTGLFGYTMGASLRNFGIDSGYVASTARYIGAVVGVAAGTSVISNVYNRATVAQTGASAYTGGLAGQVSGNSSLMDSFNEGEILGGASGFYIGGIAGYVNNAAISRCHNTAKVSGSHYIGGVVGLLGNDSSASGVYDSYSTGEITATSTNRNNSFAGGLIGYSRNSVSADYTVVENCFVIASGISAYNPGGLVGKCENTTLTSCYTVIANLSGTKPGKFISTATGVVASRCFTDYYSSRNVPLVATGTVSGISESYTLAAAAGATALGSGFMPDTLAINGGYPVIVGDFYGDVDGVVLTEVAGVYEISTLAELRKFAYMVNTGEESFEGKTVKLLNSINLMAIQFMPIGSYDSSYPFKGTFDGQGNVVRGLSISQRGVQMVAFFGYTDGASILNFGIESGVISSDSMYTAGIVGYAANNVMISNCFNNASITVTGDVNYAGGIAGRLRGGSVTECYNSGTIASSGKRVGGIIGEAADVSIARCHNSAPISVNSAVGGIAAVLSAAEGSTASITASYNTASLSASSGNSFGGGIAGDVSGNVTILNCYSIASSMKGGFGTAGLVGRMAGGSLLNSYSVVKSFSSNVFACMVDTVGENVVVENCYTDSSRVSGLPMVRSGSAAGFEAISGSELKGSRGIELLGDAYIRDGNYWPVDPVKAASSFYGWYASNVEGVVSLDRRIDATDIVDRAGDVTVYARWESIKAEFLAGYTAVGYIRNAEDIVGGTSAANASVVKPSQVLSARFVIKNKDISLEGLRVVQGAVSFGDSLPKGTTVTMVAVSGMGGITPYFYTVNSESGEQHANFNDFANVSGETGRFSLDLGFATYEERKGSLVFYFTFPENFESTGTNYLSLSGLVDSNGTDVELAPLSGATLSPSYRLEQIDYTMTMSALDVDANGVSNKANSVAGQVSCEVSPPEGKALSAIVYLLKEDADGSFVSTTISTNSFVGVNGAGTTMVDYADGYAVVPLDAVTGIGTVEFNGLSAGSYKLVANLYIHDAADAFPRGGYLVSTASVTLDTKVEVQDKVDDAVFSVEAPASSRAVSSDGGTVTFDVSKEVGGVLTAELYSGRSTTVVYEDSDTRFGDLSLLTDSGIGQVIFSADGLPAGSYTIKFILTDSDGVERTLNRTVVVL